MTKSFSAAVSAWAAQSEKRLEATYRRSVELLADEMSLTKPYGGKVPFEVGNLYRSLLASTVEMPKTAEGPFSGGDVGSVTGALRLGQPVWLGYQAIYARRVNYGYVGADVLGRTFNQHGAYFVEYAISMWPTIVDLAAEDLQAAVEARKR